MLELIQYGKNKNYPKEPKFWGMSSVLVSWDELRDNVTRLQDLPDSVSHTQSAIYDAFAIGLPVHFIVLCAFCSNAACGVLICLTWAMGLM